MTRGRTGAARDLGGCGWILRPSVRGTLSFRRDSLASADVAISGRCAKAVCVVGL